MAMNKVAQELGRQLVKGDEAKYKKQNNDACGSQLPYGQPLCKQGRCVNDFVGKVVGRKKNSKLGKENPHQQLWLGVT